MRVIVAGVTTLIDGEDVINGEGFTTFPVYCCKKLIGRVKKRYFVKMSRKVEKLFRNR